MCAEIEEQASLYNLMHIKIDIDDDIFIPTLGYSQKDMSDYIYANRCRIYPKRGCP